MDEFEVRSIIYSFIKEICHYSQMQVFATSYYQKNYFQMQIDETINNLINFYLECRAAGAEGSHFYTINQQQAVQSYQEGQDIPDSFRDIPEGIQGFRNEETTLPHDAPAIPDQVQDVQENTPQQNDVQQMRQFTIEELANYNGSEGKSAYVAVNGIVYDVSMKTRWAGGNHFGLKAGQELTEQFMGCHQGLIERLNSLPQIGVLKG